MKNKFKGLLVYLTLIALLFSGCSQDISTYSDNTEVTQAVTKSNSATKSDSKKPKKKVAKTHRRKRIKVVKGQLRAANRHLAIKMFRNIKTNHMLQLTITSHFLKRMN